jgi:hypothetical protein
MPAAQLHDANLDGRWCPVGTPTRPVPPFSEGFDPALLVDTEIWHHRITTHISMIAEGMIDAVDSEKFEHCLPDTKAVIEMKTRDIDGFLIGMRARSDHQAAQ